MSDSLIVRPAGVDDAAVIAAALAQASLDEAVVSWVVPDERARRDRLSSDDGTTIEWIRGAISGSTVLVAGTEETSVAGLSVWEFDDGSSVPPEVGSAELTAFFTQAYGEYAPRMALVHELTQRRHPRGEPHWYLQQMVVVPECRGRGLGGAMLGYQLARADADRVAAYLEASSPRNRALYERYGFRPLGDPIDLPDDGPGVQPMWRPVTG
ncbi:acetyltransferase (GNAT) family protein [Micromonospora pisi]|uniref:Acetyltransferase (GNAT) family protein n=1 Tax=Micromonospora pisi TaxID=589240 RepID=A0A495JP34_9ACTN|nr:GNAT family N-acetyltransferase [Micromonospora pisi]RKR90760.1 acetyltransferase (GNAT) family protein [Micromonospora pisi]